MTTADLDAIAERVDPRRRRHPSFLGYGARPGHDLRVGQHEIVHGIPSKHRACSTRATCCRSTAAPSGTGSTATRPSRCSSATSRRRPRPSKLVRVDGGRAGGRDRDDPPGRAPLGHRRRDRAGGRGRRVLRWCASTAGTGSGGRMHEDPFIQNFGAPGRGPSMRPGLVHRRGAHGDAREATRPGSWPTDWTVVTADGSLVGPFRAHDRRDRRTATRCSRRGARLTGRRASRPAVRGRTW